MHSKPYSEQGLIEISYPEGSWLAFSKHSAQQLGGEQEVKNKTKENNKTIKNSFLIKGIKKNNFNNLSTKISGLFPSTAEL